MPLSIEYLQVALQCWEPKVFNVKVEVLFYIIKNLNKTSTFSLNILGSKDCMMISKYLFDKSKYGL